MPAPLQRLAAGALPGAAVPAAAAVSAGRAPAARWPAPAPAPAAASPEAAARPSLWSGADVRGAAARVVPPAVDSPALLARAIRDSYGRQLQTLRRSFSAHA